MRTVADSPGPPEHVAEPTALGGVQAGGRFVEHEQVGVPQHRLGEHHAAALPAGERGDPLRGDLGETDQVDHAAHLGVPARRIRPVP